MKSTNQKKKNPKAAGVIFTICGIALVLLGLAMFVATSDYIFHGAQDIDDVISGEGLKSGNYVEINVDASFGQYAETKHTVYYIIPVGKEYHYVVWLNDDSLISVTVKGKNNQKAMDAIVDSTIDYVNGSGSLSKTLKLSGEINNVSGEKKDAYQDALDYLGVDSSVDVYYMDIDTTKTKFNVAMTDIGVIIFGVFLFIAAGASFKSAKKEKAMKAAQAANGSFYNNMGGDGMYYNGNQNSSMGSDNTYYNGSQNSSMSNDNAYYNGNQDLNAGGGNPYYNGNDNNTPGNF